MKEEEREYRKELVNLVMLLTSASAYSNAEKQSIKYVIKENPIEENKNEVQDSSDY